MAAKFQKLLLIPTLFAINLTYCELKEISETAEFDEYLKNSDKPLVVEFHAEAWCPPCKAVKKHVKNFADKHKHVHIVKVNVDQNKDLSQRFAVGGLPTFLFFEKGADKPKNEHTVVGGNTQRIEDSILALKTGSTEPAKITEKPAVCPADDIDEEKPAKKARTSKTFGKVTEIKSKEEFDDLVQSNNVVVELSKNTCQFCKYMEKPLEQLSAELKDVAFVIVNKDETPEIVEKYDAEVRGYPTFLVFKDGKFVRSFGGATQDEGKNLSILRGRVNSALGKSSMTEVVVNPEDVPGQDEEAPAPAKPSKRSAKSKRSRMQA